MGSITLDGGASHQSHEEQREVAFNAGLRTAFDFFDKQERLASSESSFRFCQLRTNQGSRWINLKPPLPYFMGRISQIDTMKQRLIDKITSRSSSSSSSSTSSSSFIQRRVPCVVLTGAEGMGKSETAIQFAHQYRNQFSVVWWMEAATPQSMERSFRELAEALDISIDRSHSFEYVRGTVYHFLETEPLDNPYLLIFDNAEEAIELSQGSNGRFIITTTNPRHFPERDILPIGVFDSEEAVDVLHIILEQEKNEEMHQLANEIGCFPVILSQAAQHIRSTKMTLDVYLELLAEEKLKVIEMMPPDARYSKTQISAWQITHKRLKEREPLVYEWLEICAHLQPDAIPFSYLDIWFKLFKSHLSPVERVLSRSLILETLNSLGILRFDEKREAYSLHRMRQDMIQATHEPDRRHTLRKQVMHLLAAIGRSLNLEENGEWSTFPPHEPHFRFILNADDLEFVIEVEGSSVNMSRIDMEITNHFWMSPLELIHPRLVLEQVEDVAETLCRDEVYIRNLLGRWLLMQGKLSEAKTCLTKSLKLLKSKTSGDGIDLANTLHYLGNCFLPHEAVGYYLASYLMRRRHYVGDHVDLAASLHNLGRCCHPITDFKIAESYFNEALDMLKRLYPDGHYLMALILTNKGDYYRCANKSKEALVYTLEALRLLEKLYPERNECNYPFVSNQSIMVFVLEQLGRLFEKRGRHKEAVGHYKKAIDIEKDMNFNENHSSNNPSVFKSLGATLLNMRSYHEAKIYNLKALELYRKNQIDNNGFLYELLHNLGFIEYQLNQTAQAKIYLKESLECYRASIDQVIDHQDGIRVLKQAFRILSKIDNTQTKEGVVNYFRDLGNSLEAIGKNVEAALYFAEADRIENSWSCSIS